MSSLVYATQEGISLVPQVATTAGKAVGTTVSVQGYSQVVAILALGDAVGTTFSVNYQNAAGSLVPVTNGDCYVNAAGVYKARINVLEIGPVPVISVDATSAADVAVAAIILMGSPVVSPSDEPDFKVGN